MCFALSLFVCLTLWMLVHIHITMCFCTLVEGSGHPALTLIHYYSPYTHTLCEPYTDLYVDPKSGLHCPLVTWLA